MKKIVTAVVAASLLSTASFAFANQRHPNEINPNSDRRETATVVSEKIENQASLAVPVDYQDVLKVDPYSMKYGTSSHTNR